MLWTGRLCLLSVESVRRAPLPADEQGKWTFIHTRAASLLSKMHRNLPGLLTAVVWRNTQVSVRPRPSCYATSAAKRHESQSTSRPQRAPARATLASQSSAEADRKEEIWKSGEISRNQVIWGHWPAETDGFTSLHLGVYFARAGKRAVVVFPDNRHYFLHECIICPWLPCMGLLCVHIATDATVHAASLLNWDVLPVLCLLAFPLRSWSTARSTVPASNRHLAPPHHLQLNFIQKY